MNKITISAPGKLMLFGEHAVVYGHPCIVTAVDQRMFVTVEKNNSGEFLINAPDVDVLNYKKKISEIGKGDIPKGVQFVEVALGNVLKKNKFKLQGLTISTRSEFSSKFGFGSSSASTVCVVKALSELFSLELTNKEIFDIAYKTVLDIQGKGSGFDVAAAIYGETLYFVTGGKKIEPLKIKNLPLIVGYSGVKADTVALINQVTEKFGNNQKRLEQLYHGMHDIVEQAKGLIISQNWEEAGGLMSENQKLLQELGVSIPKLDAMIEGAVEGGAYGGKLSGAGGGDCIVAFGNDKSLKLIKKGIEKAGGEVLKVTANAQGVRIEK